MEQWSSLVAAVLSGVLLAAVIFYVWGRRVERRAADTSQRLILAAKEELMSVRENLHKSLDQKLAGVDRREADLHKTEQQLQERARSLDKREQGIGARLAQVAGLTAQEAKLELVTRLETEARDEAAALVRNITEQAKKNADREAKKIIARAIQRIAAEQAAQAGEQAVYDTGVRGMHAELVKLVGRMKYRTSYGQNILEHSKEVAYLAGMMAAELKLDVSLAKRGALLHDVGKVLTHEHDGTHVQLGVEVATKYGEHPIVINSIAAHHDDVAHESPISVIVQAADAVSGSRPGARREAFETYVKRLTQLEQLAGEFPGVEKVFAIQAGREVRVVVTPSAIDDGKAGELSDQIARKIERELQYPGQIKVVVIRETRAVDFAR